MTAWSAAVPAEARRYQGRRAGLVSRAIAAAVDAGVAALTLAGCYLVWVAGRFTLDPAGFVLPVPTRPGLTTAGATLEAGYLTLCWTATGRTVGAQLLGLRLLDARGRLPRPGRAALRSVLCVLFPLGLLWVLVGAGRRSIQDLLLRTVVVYDWDPRPPGSPGRCDAPGPAPTRR